MLNQSLPYAGYFAEANVNISQLMVDLQCRCLKSVLLHLLLRCRYNVKPAGWVGEGGGPQTGPSDRKRAFASILTAAVLADRLS